MGTIFNWMLDKPPRVNTPSKPFIVTFEHKLTDGIETLNSHRSSEAGSMIQPSTFTQAHCQPYLIKINKMHCASIFREDEELGATLDDMEVYSPYIKIKEQIVVWE